MLSLRSFSSLLLPPWRQQKIKYGILSRLHGGNLVAREDDMTFEELTEIIAMMLVAGLAMALFGCYLTAQLV